MLLDFQFRRLVIHCEVNSPFTFLNSTVDRRLLSRAGLYVSGVVQMVEAEARQRAIYRLTFNLTNDLTERRLIDAAQCQRLIHDHLRVPEHRSFIAENLIIIGPLS